MIKKLLLGLVGVVLVVGSIIAASSFKDSKQEELLKNEIDEVMNLFNSETLNEDKMNELLSREVTTKDYKVVEKAFKSYVKDYLNDLNYFKIKEVLKDERIYTILSVDNYISDGKGFIKSTKYLKETIEFLKESQEKFSKYTNEETIMSYLGEDELQKYYIDLYKKEINNNINSVDNNKNVESNLNKITTILVYTEDIIKLLKENPDSWRIDNKEIIFSSEQVMNDYNNLLKQIGNVS